MSSTNAVIRGEKINLRPMIPDEISIFYKWAVESDFWYSRDRKPSMEEFLANWKPYYFDGSAPEKGRCFMIELNNNPVGVICYNNIDGVNKKVELDIIIAGEETSKGYGTYALKTLIKYLFDEFDLNRIFTIAGANNPRAIRAYKKAGFTQEGVLREADYFNGEFIDCVVLSILRREFESTPHPTSYDT